VNYKFDFLISNISLIRAKCIEFQLVLVLAIIVLANKFIVILRKFPNHKNPCVSVTIYIDFDSIFSILRMCTEFLVLGKDDPELFRVQTHMTAGPIGILGPVS
jgi:hypothetical protein